MEREPIEDDRSRGSMRSEYRKCGPLYRAGILNGHYSYNSSSTLWTSVSSRFDGIVAPTRKKARSGLATPGTGTGLISGEVSKAPSVTPDPNLASAVPSKEMAASDALSLPTRTHVVAATTGPGGVRRSAAKVPRRIQELRRESTSAAPPPLPSAAAANVAVSPAPSSTSTGANTSSTRKGRPPGSKNLHARRDKGVKKGPRKPKAASPVSVEDVNQVESAAEETWQW